MNCFKFKSIEILFLFLFLAHRSKIQLNLTVKFRKFEYPLPTLRSSLSAGR